MRLAGVRFWLAALLLIGLVALVMIAWTWLRPPAPLPPVDGPAAVAGGADEAAGAQPMLPRRESVTIIANRPLFSPSRRPDAPAQTGAARGRPRLVGLFGGSRATFELSDGSVQIVRQGERVQGWRVTAVSRQGVVLKRAGQVERLELLAQENR